MRDTEYKEIPYKVKYKRRECSLGHGEPTLRIPDMRREAMLEKRY
jgi:hypothetical protein